MNATLFHLLRCPQCGKRLQKTGAQLQCLGCSRRFPIASGVPVLVDLERLPAHLRGQIAYFEKEDASRAIWTLEPWQERYVENFLRWGKPKQHGLIIDNATGSGYMTMELARRGFQVIATDLTVRELIKLRNNLIDQGLEKRVLLVCCDSQRLPFADGIADGLVANAILEHLPDEDGAVAEITRVVKAGAPVMAAMPLAYRLLLPFLWLPNWFHDRRIGHLRRYDRATILQKFSGFREITTYYTGHLIKIVCLVFFLLTKNNQWNKRGETWGRLFASFPYGANNIVSVLRKI